MRICRGVTRTVILTRHWAIKVPSLRAYNNGPRGVLWSVTRGIQANLSEAEWSGTPGTCPVRWTLAGLVNIYPRCTPVDHDPTVEEYEATGFLGPTDQKPGNVGYLNGLLVWIDYDQSWNDCLACRRRGFNERGRASKGAA